MGLVFGRYLLELLMQYAHFQRQVPSILLKKLQFDWQHETWFCTCRVRRFLRQLLEK